ncbi:MULTISPECIES: hypothetical protein [Vagococcus]|uniref:hypothetical protein n=1 Tax=Vagococcus TaxID=2737 RepID=UPI002FC5E047
MKKEQLETLMRVIGPEKKYLSDGYYRIREVDENRKELAFLKPDGCGTTTVTPQITIEKQGDNWLPIKFIDMGSSPTKMLIRDEKTEQLLDEELVILVEKMLSALKK